MVHVFGSNVDPWLSIVVHALKSGNVSQAVETLIDGRNAVRELLSGKKDAEIFSVYDTNKIFLPHHYDREYNRVEISAYALSKRLRIPVNVRIPTVVGRTLFTPILREFAYLPAFQYMYDTHIQLPKLWERSLLDSRVDEISNGSLRGVSYSISGIYTVSFFPLRIGTYLEYPKYLSIAYRYLSKIKDSKISLLMSKAFGEDVSVSYVVRNIDDLRAQDSSVSLLFTVPRLRSGRVYPILNLVVNVRMINGAEVRFVDETVSTYPILLSNARMYIEDAPKDYVAISPTTLSMILTSI